MAFVLTTPRLTLRHLTVDDAPLIVALLNSPGWLRYIGDRGVRTLDDARAYLTRAPLASYAQHGFGLYHVAQRHDGAPVGMCGLIKREYLEDVDLGFALLPEFEGRGYTSEAGAAVIEHARRDFQLRRLAAIVQADNAASIRVLGKLGFSFERMITLPTGDPLQFHARAL